MTSSPESTMRLHTRPVHCPQCGYFNDPRAVYCTHCGTEQASGGAFVTRQLSRPPTLQPSSPACHDHFESGAYLVLQFLPTGACLSLPIHRPVILGRGPFGDDLANVGELLDLSQLCAQQHGVSRQHCRLERRGQHLMITDLNSTNGTYLNTERLVPYQASIAMHTDQLSLGTLHITLTFEVIELRLGASVTVDPNE